MKNTYDRYKQALEDIANGSEDERSVAIAVEALRSRIPVAKIKIVRRTAAEIKAAGRRRADLIFNAWEKAGRPPMRTFAPSINMHPQTCRGWISRGEAQKYWRYTCWKAQEQREEVMALKRGETREQIWLRRFPENYV